MQAALNGRAELDLEDPVVVTAPPPSGSVPLGMPVWLAIDDTDGSPSWGPLRGEGCDGSLCVRIEAHVDRVVWDLGNGDVRTCPSDRNERWRPGMDYLDPAGVCHYYYRQPSRNLPDGRYPVKVTAYWHTHWWADALGMSSEDTPLEHQQATSTTVQVEEIQVLVGGDE